MRGARGEARGAVVISHFCGAGAEGKVLELGLLLPFASCARAESRRACTPPRERPTAPSGGHFCNV